MIKITRLSTATCGGKKTPVTTHGHVFDTWQGGEHGIPSRICQRAALDWTLTVTKPVQWPTIAAWWCLASHWCWLVSINKKVKYFTIKRNSVILFHGTLCIISSLKNYFCCAKRPTRGIIVYSCFLQGSKFTKQFLKSKQILGFGWWHSSLSSCLDLTKFIQENWTKHNAKCK